VEIKNCVGISYGKASQTGTEKSIANGIKKSEHFYFGNQSTIPLETKGK